jgi:zinc protease
VDVPSSKQSVIYVGSPSLPGNDENFYAATVANYPLGGSFTSRLNTTLREEKGYTYGARSSFSRQMNEGFFQASSSVRSNVTPESLEIFKDKITNYKDSYSEEDLERSKSVLIKSKARAFETLSQKMGILQNISTYELPLDYIRKEQQVITDMTVEQAKELIDKYINPKNMIYLIVGDAATQAEKIKYVGLGDPIMLDKEGTPVRALPN